MSIVETIQWTTLAEPPTPDQEAAWVQDKVELCTDFSKLSGAGVYEKYGQQMHAALLLLLHYAQDYSTESLQAMREAGKDHPVYAAAKALDIYTFGSYRNGFPKSIYNSFCPAPKSIDVWVTLFGAAAGYAMVGDFECRELLPHWVSRLYFKKHRGEYRCPDGYELSRQEDRVMDPYKWWEVFDKTIKENLPYYEAMMTFCCTLSHGYVKFVRNQEIHRFAYSLPAFPGTLASYYKEKSFSREFGELLYEEFERRCLNVFAQQKDHCHYLILPIIRTGFWQLLTLRGVTATPAEDVEASRVQAKAQLQAFYERWGN